MTQLRTNSKTKPSDRYKNYIAYSYVISFANIKPFIWKVTSCKCQCTTYTWNCELYYISSTLITKREAIKNYKKLHKCKHFIQNFECTLHSIAYHSLKCQNSHFTRKRIRWQGKYRLQLQVLTNIRIPFENTNKQKEAVTRNKAKTNRIPYMRMPTPNE